MMNTWGNEINIKNQENLFLQNRYKYVREHINDLNYFFKKVKFKRVGHVYISLCPFDFHKEKTASFVLYPKGYINGDGEQQKYISFYCFGCGNGGDIIKFHQIYNKIETREEACQKLEEEYGMDIDSKDIRQEILKENLECIKMNNSKLLNFESINQICSNICRNYLEWVKDNYPHLLQSEFEVMEKYYNHLDEEFLESTMENVPLLISNTENIVNQRKLIVINR